MNEPTAPDEDELVTAPLGDTILAGVTRDSVLALASDLGLVARERPIAVKELVEGARSGRLKEVFGTGTAAVISPVGELAIDGEKLSINGGAIGEVAQKLYDAITAIQYGKAPDPRGWRQAV